MAQRAALEQVVLVLQLASQTVEGIQRGVTRRGFTDARPAHGFAFMRIAAGDATTATLAEHLGVTKQAASQLVGQLVERGYVERWPDPADGRARRLRLTDRGWDCTRAAEEAAGDVAEHWRETIGDRGMELFNRSLRALAGRGRLRPAW